jgi:branched-chain amino acid transport system permease protein
MINFILQQIINAIGYGCILGLLGIGYTIIYGVAGLINFAHGEIFMIASIVAYLVGYLMQASFIYVSIVAIITALCCGLLLNYLIYQPCIKRRSSVLTIFIASFGASVFLRFLLLMLLTDRRRPFPIPLVFEHVFSVGELRVPLKDVITLGISIVVVIITVYIVKYTRTGIAMRAFAFDKETAQVMGISLSRITTIAFVLGGSLAGVAAIVYGLTFGVVYPTMGFLPGLYGFMAAVIGGIGNVLGGFIGGILLGFAEIFTVAFFPPALSPLRPLLVWVILILIMLFKPTGLFKPNIKFEELRG